MIWTLVVAATALLTAITIGGFLGEARAAGDWVNRAKIKNPYPFY